MNNHKNICPKCFKDIKTGSFCPFCGSNTKKHIKKRQFHTFLWIAIPSIVVLSIMTFAWFTLASKATVSTGITNVSESQEVNLPNSSNGSSDLIVPNLAGLDFDKMQQSFITSGEFRLLLSNREFSETVDSGCIISQTPEKGSSVLRGSIIAVTVSQGTKNVTLPNIAGSEFSDATFKLRSVGFNVQKVEQCSTTVQKGHVIGYDGFADGQTAEYGSEIRVIVSLGQKY